MSSFEVKIIEPWNEISYEEALAKQNQLNSAGGVGWILFCCPPTITLGTQGHFSDVLMPMDELKRLGVKLLPVSRGGQVTYHGPGQIIAFPYGRLSDHVGDPRGVKKFICRLEANLKSWLQSKFQELRPDLADTHVDGSENTAWLS